MLALAELGFAVAIYCRQAMEAGEALAKEVEAMGGRAVVVAADLARSAEASGDQRTANPTANYRGNSASKAALDMASQVLTSPARDRPG